MSKDRYSKISLASKSSLGAGGRRFESCHPDAFNPLGDGVKRSDRITGYVEIECWRENNERISEND